MDTVCFVFKPLPFDYFGMFYYRLWSSVNFDHFAFVRPATSARRNGILGNSCNRPHCISLAKADTKGLAANTQNKTNKILVLTAIFLPLHFIIVPQLHWFFPSFAQPFLVTQNSWSVYPLLPTPLTSLLRPQPSSAAYAPDRPRITPLPVERQH